jgi:hypothetical protein
MGDHASTIIAIAVISVVIIALVAFFVLRAMKGSLVLRLNEHQVAPDGAFSGTVELTCRKPIEGNRLIVTLIGRERIEEKTKEGTKTRNREFYRDEEVLESARDYEAGFEQTYEFEIAAPSAKNVQAAASPLGKMMEMGIEMLTGRDRDLSWKIEGRLDAKGLDLVQSEKVRITFF